MTMKKTKLYQKPAVKVVAFKVENGFGSIIGGTSTDTDITFGGNRDYGLMNHGNGDHSGLGAYDDGGNIFGSTAGN